MFRQLMDYFTDNDLFCIEQYGFRPGHSTELAAINLVNHTILQMDAMNMPINIYIDLSKAFDILDHSILFSKLEHYGVRGKAHLLIKSYLSNRMQYVDFDSCCSTSKLVSIGVPQGSIIGPLLFLIYINDLPLVSKMFSMIMYADDTTLYCNLNDVNNDIAVNVELGKISEWLASNKLLLNANKTKCIVFHTHQRKVEYPVLKINNTIIEQVHEFNFLGLILNSQLTWKSHIDHIAVKISKTLGVMYRLKHVYPKSVLLMLYNTLVVSHFNYCLLAWGASIYENHRIHKLQKRALRTITCNDFLAHTEHICKNLGLLKVTDMFRINVWKFYFKLMNNLLPPYFDQMKPVLPIVCNFHDIRRPTYHLPKIKHKFAECLLKYQLIKLLNDEYGNILITSKVHTHSFVSFKYFIKGTTLATYQDDCHIHNCYSCSRN